MALYLRDIDFFKLFNPNWLMLFYILESYFIILTMNFYLSFSLVGFYVGAMLSIVVFKLLNRSMAIDREQSIYNETMQYFVGYFNIGIMILDKNKTILSVNHNFLNMKNVNLSLVGRPYEEIKDMLQISKDIDKGLDEVNSINSFYETTIIDENKYYTINVISTDDNKTIKYIILLKDITQEYYEKINFINEQRLTSLEELAAGTANDIKNPLAVASGFLQLIKSKINDKQLENYTNEAIKAIEVTDGHIELFALLGNGVKNHHKHKDFNFSKQLSHILNHYKKVNSNINFVNEITNNITINGDRILLTKAIRFILQNAIEAVDCVNEKEILIKLSEHPKEIQLEIIDNGIGIEEENILKVFDPYYSTKKNNSHGLGLFYAKKIIKHHDGQISITSSNDIRTIVKIQFKK